jgi:hypothetical protein
MPPVNVRPVAEAATVFRRLGYAVSDEGPEFRARRKWRTVHVTVLDGDEATASSPRLADGGRTDGPTLRCYVTWLEHAGRLCERLDATAGDDWAVVGVTDDGEHEVVRA